MWYVELIMKWILESCLSIVIVVTCVTFQVKNISKPFTFLEFEVVTAITFRLRTTIEDSSFVHTLFSHSPPDGIKIGTITLMQ